VHKRPSVPYHYSCVGRMHGPLVSSGGETQNALSRVVVNFNDVRGTKNALKTDNDISQSCSRDGNKFNKGNKVDKHQDSTHLLSGLPDSQS
jgi:hypothetical protein